MELQSCFKATRTICREFMGHRLTFVSNLSFVHRFLSISGCCSDWGLTSCLTRQPKPRNTVYVIQPYSANYFDSISFAKRQQQTNAYAIYKNGRNKVDDKREYHTRARTHTHTNTETHLLMNESNGFNDLAKNSPNNLRL